MPALTPEERSAALAELESSRRHLLGALEGLAEDQWSRPPAPGRWSIAECAEHIVAAELPLDRFFASGARLQPTDEERREIRRKDEFVSSEETIQTFEERRAANLAYVRETAEPLRDRFAPHPFAGVLDGYQWVLFLAAHTDRHAAQIQEIRDSSD